MVVASLRQGLPPFLIWVMEREKKYDHLHCGDCSFFEEEKSHCAIDPENYGIRFSETPACKMFYQETDYEYDW